MQKLLFLRKKSNQKNQWYDKTRQFFFVPEASGGQKKTRINETRLVSRCVSFTAIAAFYRYVHSIIFHLEVNIIIGMKEDKHK